MNHRYKFSIYLNYFVYAILLNSVGIVILKSIKIYEVSKIQASNLELFKDASIAIASFAAAGLIPMMGNRKSMILSLVIVIIGMLQMFLFNSFLSAQILFATIGVSFSLVKVNVYASIGILTNTVSAHNRLMSSIEGVFMFGIATAYFLFPAFQNSANPDSWLNVYPFLIVICLLSIFVLLSTPELSTENERAKTNDQHLVRSLLKLIGQSLVIVFLISAFCFVMVEQSIMTWLPTFNNEVLHLGERESIQMASILALSLGAGRLFAGWISRYLAWPTTLSAFIILGMGLVYYLLPLALGTKPDISRSGGSIPLIAFVFPLIGFFIAPIYPLLNSAVLSSLPKSYHSTMAGLIIISSALGGTLGSRITGYFFDLLGGGAFYFSLVPMATLLICIQILKRITVNNKQCFSPQENY